MMEREEGLVELLDGPLDSATLAGNLRDLERFNRWLGGAELSWRALQHVQRWRSSTTPLTMLDVGTGAADIPLQLLRRARRAGIDLHIEASDVRPEIVTAARRRAGKVDGLTVSLAGEESLALPSRSIDVVHASLVLHHHDPQPAVRLLAEMGRVARTAVIVNDLMRGRRWWLAAWFLTRVATGNRYTRHDAPLSVRRAYLPQEVLYMAKGAGLQEDARFTDRLGYRYAIVFRPLAE
jgi:hypothetical protein